MAAGDIYYARSGVWAKRGSPSIDPLPDSDPQFPGLLTFPAWDVFPGTGA